MNRKRISKMFYNSNTTILLFQTTAMNLELPFDDGNLVALNLPLWLCGLDR